jgi:hypothetical protein
MRYQLVERDHKDITPLKCVIKRFGSNNDDLLFLVLFLTEVMSVRRYDGSDDDDDDDDGRMRWKELLTVKTNVVKMMVDVGRDR